VGLAVGLLVGSSVGSRVGMRVGLLVGIGNIPISPEGLEEVVGLPVGISVGLMVLLCEMQLLDEVNVSNHRKFQQV